MQQQTDHFPELFCRALQLLPDDASRNRFMGATIGCMEHYLGEAMALDCMDAALDMTQGVAVVPEPQQQGMFLVKR